MYGVILMFYEYNKLMFLAGSFYLMLITNTVNKKLSQATYVLNFHEYVIFVQLPCLKIIIFVHLNEDQ